MDRPLLLPIPSGSSIVGCTDIVSKFGIDRLLVRLFYPTSDFYKPESAPLWLPEEPYVHSFANLKSMDGLSWALYNRLNRARIPAAWNVECVLSDGKSKLPVVIFSHAWASNRLVYSAICTELASKGIVVAVLEHADRSASTTFYLESTTDSSGELKVVKKWLDLLDFNDEPLDSSRDKQLETRVDDCLLLLNLLQDINEGSFSGVHCEIDLFLFKDALNLTQVGIMGHGFGGTTALAALEKDSRFSYGACFGGMLTHMSSSQSSTSPVLFLNSSDKYRTSKIISKTLNLALKPAEDGTEHSMLTILETVNMSHTDFPLLINQFVGNWFRLCGKSDPHLVNEVRNKLILGFIGEQLGVDYGGDVADVMEIHGDLITPGIVMDVDASKTKEEKQSLRIFL